MHQTCPGLLSANWEGNQLTLSYPPHSVKTTSAPTCRRYSQNVAWKLGGTSRTFYPGWPATQVCRVRARPGAAAQRSLYDCQLRAPGVLRAVSFHHMELILSSRPARRVYPSNRRLLYSEEHANTATASRGSRIRRGCSGAHPAQS